MHLVVPLRQRSFRDELPTGLCLDHQSSESFARFTASVSVWIRDLGHLFEIRVIETLSDFTGLRIQHVNPAVSRGSRSGDVVLPDISASELSTSESGDGDRAIAKPIKKLRTTPVPNLALPS